MPDGFPLELRQYLPNVNYRADTQRQGDRFHVLLFLGRSVIFLKFHLAFYFRPLRCVVLVSLRDINHGEELFSNYYTIVH